MSAPNWARLIGRNISRNSPAILSGLAVAGVVSTAVLAARAAIKVSKEIDGLEVTPKQLVKNNWQDFLPAAISGAATIACVVGANQIGARRNAALLGAYTIADTAFREYKDEVLNQLGKNKEMKVQEAVQQRHIDEKPANDAQVIITGGGDQICYESLTGRYFRSDIEAIRRAENELNRRMLAGDMYASHNEFYELIGLEGVTAGEELGWNIENLIELVFTSHLSPEGKPCLAIGYARLPRVDYNRF